MPAPTFYQPVEKILYGKCAFEYYTQSNDSYSKSNKSRICHVTLDKTSERNKDIILMIFTIRNQPSTYQNPVWKIHSEGPRRTDPGSTVPLRNTAVNLAKKNGWKYFAIAVAGEDTPSNDVVSRYIVSMESYEYGNDTVYDLTQDLNKLISLGEPDFYRNNVNVNGTIYSLSFIKKDKFIDYISMFDNRPYDFREEDKDQLTDVQSEGTALGGINKIYYGAPGCGKSRHVSDMLREAHVSKENIVRVTFHPEYSNVDFIGQILPTVTKDEESGEDIVKYIFNPGSFSLALQKAYNTTDMVYLIVEEINRGNAAAIFGDMFQLLDREIDSTKLNFSASEYPVNNPNLQKYLIEHVSNDAIKERLSNGVYIPSNLTILATMNSSDQNVFTLDTAFKRRWRFEQISNDISKDMSHPYKGWYVPGTEVTWEKFLNLLNDKILDYKIYNQTNEDKRLGKFFVTQNCLTKDVQNIKDVQDEAMEFAYKVLEYIWNDVCKIGREDWFDTEEYRTLEEVISAFIAPTGEDTPLSVFRNITFKK